MTLFYVAAAGGIISSLIFTLLVSPDPIRIAGLEPAADEGKVEARVGLGH